MGATAANGTELAELLARMTDRAIFDALRLDPYYRATARAHPAEAPCFEKLVASVLDHPRSLVHADFSPKNLLVHRGGVMLVDFETGHFGDPAFDLGFFLSHLLLKTIRHRPRFDDFAGLTTAFWDRYTAGISTLSEKPSFAPGEVHRRTVAHLAGGMWARIDGTSKIDYLPEPALQEMVRRFSKSLLLDAPADWPALLERLRGCV